MIDDELIEEMVQAGIEAEKEEERAEREFRQWQEDIAETPELETAERPTWRLPPGWIN